jgi:hypothetical protein
MINYEVKTENGKEVFTKNDKELKGEVSSYMPTEEAKKVIAQVRDDFTDGYVSMYKPRLEFNDVSLIDRVRRDQLAWNTYQVNDGDGYEEDISDAWRSRAMRPVVRNKCISITAHATSRLIFPKVFAFNQQSEEQKDSAKVMRDLIEWSADQSDYAQTALFSCLASVINPASITYTEYCEVYRWVKRDKVDGKWQWVKELDEEKSGFKDILIPIDQLFIENFYEYNIQNQGFIIWRRVQSYDLMKQKYGHLENFQFVQKGVRVFYNDANDTFYNIYDDEIEDRLCEEILYWNKSQDLFLQIVNGVLLCDPDNPNPRLDKQYPFAKTIYEPIDERKFFYGKSLAFKLKSDADIVNTLYPLVIDGTYLSVIPPMINSGDANVDNSVVVPGAMTSLGEGNDVKPVQTGSNLRDGINMLNQVEESVNESSQNPLKSPTEKGQQTAYEMALRERDRQTILGLFIDMIGKWVNDYNKLRISDIIQYLTIGEVDKIVDNAPLIYKTFLLPERQTEGGKKTRKIKFDGQMKDEMGDDEFLKESYKVLEEDGDETEVYKVNPALFRNLKYQLKVTPDVMNPISEELERAYGLEAFNEAIKARSAGVNVDLEKSYKDFVLSNNPKSKNNPDEYIKEQTLDENNILDTMGMKPKVGEGMTLPSERALKQQPPAVVGA